METYWNLSSVQQVGESYNQDVTEAQDTANRIILEQVARAVYSNEAYSQKCKNYSENYPVDENELLMVITADGLLLTIHKLVALKIKGVRIQFSRGCLYYTKEGFVHASTYFIKANNTVPGSIYSK
ncbi:UNVERIFIED_CONTAM: hypothetical protein K2H54_061319 [Gekko kuhli]